MILLLHHLAAWREGLSDPLGHLISYLLHRPHPFDLHPHGSLPGPPLHGPVIR